MDEKETRQDITTLTRIGLQQEIRAYPADQWVGSVEHKELMRWFNTWSVEKLGAEGYFVPAWKRVS